MLDQNARRDELVSGAEAPGAVVPIDGLVWKAFVLLEALDRRTLATITPPLSTAQYHALVALAAAPDQNLGELAARLLCAKGNASGLVDRLSALGLVDRSRDPADARRVVIRLTPAGQDALSRAVRARAAALQRALAPAGSAEQAAITRSLNHLVTLFETSVRGEQR